MSKKQRTELAPPTKRDAILAWFPPEQRARFAMYIDAALRPGPEPASVDLARIFCVGHPYGSSRAEVDDLRRAIARRGVVRTHVALPGPPPAAEASRWARLTADFSGRSVEHRELCALAARWLESRGVAWTADDLGYAGGGHADVMAADRSVAVECGYTQASKVLAGVVSGLRVLVVPYPHEIDQPHAVGFEFAPGKRARAERRRAVDRLWRDPAAGHIRIDDGD